ncbi:MAG: all-trans-retinol 13,14-reductase [Myxococcota bacterium]|jgi:all-trans-retinol 13,14-reductase
MHRPTHATARRVRAVVPEQVDVAIIGAGPGGLVAGATLARRGLQVALFDAHYVAGGNMTQFARTHKDRTFCFDVGLHYVGACQPGGMLHRILEELDVDVHFEPLEPDGFDEIVLPELRFRIPVGLEAYRERLVAHFPSERRGIDRWCRLVREVDTLSRHPPGKLTPALAMDAILRGRLAIRYKGATIAQFLDSCTTDPVLRGVILGQHGDYALPPSRVSALMHAGLANHYLHGAFYPRGGGQIISDRLAESIEAQGGTVHLRHPVKEVLTDESGRAVGLRYADKTGSVGEIRARAVLSNADLIQTLTELVPDAHLPEVWRHRLGGFEMAGALFMTCLGVRGDMRARGMRAANVWQFDSCDHEGLYRQLEEGGGPGAAYITSGSLKDPTTSHHAPEGYQTVEVMSIVSGRPEHWGVPGQSGRGLAYRKNEAYLARKQAVEDDMVARLERLFPGTEEAIVFRESATPLTQTRFTWASAGTSYGLAATPEQFLERRPGFRGPLQGMYLCGASTQTGHGILGAMASGRAAGRIISKDLTKRSP